MKLLKTGILFIAAACLSPWALAEEPACASWLDHSLPKLHSSKQEVDVCAAAAGKPVLLVNTASHCGFTPQFEGLEALYQQYKDQGLTVIGFPSNDFNQEAKSAEETAEVCYVNYGVTFLMTDKIHVKGDKAHPIFQELGKVQDAPSWNFNKYLVDRNGRIVEHFSSRVTPESDEMISAVESVL